MSQRTALSAPKEPVVVVSSTHLEDVQQAARESGRLRMILPFHKSHEDPLHRMFNALQPGTYVQPHRHHSSPKAEVFLVLRGAIEFVTFDDTGVITNAFWLEAGGEQFGIDLAPGVYHSFLSRAPDTVLYEVKLGPYAPVDAKDFAPWAPAEGSSEVPAYVERLEQQLIAFRTRAR